MTKQEIADYLATNAIKVKKLGATDLYDRIVYTAKAWKKDFKAVSASDFRMLYKDTVKVLEEGVTKPPTEPDASQAVASANISPKKTLSKVNKEPIETLPPSSKNSIPLAKKFPETIDTDDGLYKIAHDIKTIQDLSEADDNGENIVFAFYWNKRHLKQFDYMDMRFKQPVEFDNDLDLAIVVNVSEKGVVAYAMSAYTEAMYAIFPEDFEEDTEYNLRLSNGMEYQIYRLTDEVEDSEVDID